MKYRMLVMLILIPLIGSAQNLIKYNDSTVLFLNQKENFYCYIKLVGSVQKTDNKKVIVFNDYPLQSILTNKKDYTKNGNDDTSILVEYIKSETQYFTDFYKKRLDLLMIPFQFKSDTKAIIWEFDIPKNIQVQSQAGENPAIKQVSISIVIGDYIYSIGTTLFKDQIYNDLKKMLTDLIVTVQYDLGQPNLSLLVPKKVDGQNLSDFKSILDDCGMNVNIPTGYEECTIIENYDLNYEYAIKYPNKDFELRYAVRPIRYKVYANDQVRDELEGQRNFRNTNYREIFKTVILTLTGGVEYESQEFNKDAVKNEFNADWGATTFVELNSDFGIGYKYCMIVGLHKDDIADAYYFYLSNSKDSFSENMDPLFHTLKFDNQIKITNFLSCDANGMFVPAPSLKLPTGQFFNAPTWLCDTTPSR